MRSSIINWTKLMDSFELQANREAYHFLLKKYSEKHRAYHNIQHVEDCLGQLDQLEMDASTKQEIELAIWYHDVIYDSYKPHNELKSAEAAKQFLESRIKDQAQISRIYELILITKHDQPVRTEAEALIIDIDISILGRSPEKYSKYTRAIRKEYKLVPFFIYKKKRKEIMINFLKRERLYTTERYYDLFEEQARKNIANEIKTLK